MHISASNAETYSSIATQISSDMKRVLKDVEDIQQHFPKLDYHQSFERQHDVAVSQIEMLEGRASVV